MIKYIIFLNMLLLSSLLATQNIHAPLQQRGVVPPGDNTSEQTKGDSWVERAVVGTGSALLAGGTTVGTYVLGAASIAGASVLGFVVLGICGVAWWYWGTKNVRDAINKIKETIEENLPETTFAVSITGGLVVSGVLSFMAGLSFGTSMLFCGIGAAAGAASWLFGYGVFYLLCALGFPSWFSCIFGLFAGWVAFRLAMGYLKEKIEQAKAEQTKQEAAGITPAGSSMFNPKNAFGWIFSVGGRASKDIKRLDAIVWDYLMEHYIGTTVSCFALLLVGGGAYSLYNKGK
jgi:hypothetical protein